MALHMIYKKTYAEVYFMLGYVLLGASIGAVVGYIIPPGSLFWFAMGAMGGYGASRYMNYHRY